MATYPLRFLLALLCLHCGTQLTAEVPLWGRFEGSLNATQVYADPYRNVSLNTTFTRPDGSEIQFWGFYDGGSTWRFRVRPDQLGTWSYTARFSDNSTETSGTFEVVPGTIPGALGADRVNPAWFGYTNGRHVLVRSLHVGDRFFASNWSASSRTDFLDWAQEQGYNMLSIASFLLNRDANGRGRGWDTPALWNLAQNRPVPAEYTEMEAILDDLAERQILVYPFAGFFGRDGDYPTSTANQQLFVRYTMARLGVYWNLLLMVGGPEPRNSDYLTVSQVEFMGETIADNNVFGQLLSVHNATDVNDYLQYDWATYHILQGPKTLDLNELFQGNQSRRDPNAPLYAQETLWWANRNHPPYTLAETRRNAFVLNMAAVALNFSDNGGGNSSAGFSGSMDLSELDPAPHNVVKFVWDIFAGFPYYRMFVAPEVVASGTAFCLAEHGERYLVYLPYGGSPSLDLPTGSYDVLWVDADAPAARQREVVASTGNLVLPAPGPGDWLAYLVREDPTLWTHAEPVGAGWWEAETGLPVFRARDWAWTEAWGWFYVAASTPEHVFGYSGDFGWFLGRPDLYPLYYVFNGDEWLPND